MKKLPCSECVQGKALEKLDEKFQHIHDWYTQECYMCSVCVCQQSQTQLWDQLYSLIVSVFCSEKQTQTNINHTPNHTPQWAWLVPKLL